MRDHSRSRDRGRDRAEKDKDRGDKDKDKKKKKKRSASSDSAERSREREKRRRKQQQQYVSKTRKPAGESSLPGASDMGGGGQRMFWDGFQWVPRADTGINVNDMDASRKLRRLYVGNLPYHLGVTEDSFSKQLYETMKERSMCNDPNQNPLLHVWFARDKGANYGFCEIASIEETERALQLDGMLVLGMPVSIKRPNDTISPMGMIGAVPPGMRMGMPGVGGPMLALPPMQVMATSSIIRIEKLLNVDDKTTQEDFDDVVEDMNEGCGSHGKLLKAFVIKPEHVARKPGFGLQAGDVFLECASVDEATKIMRAMGHRKYDSRQISMKSFEESPYHSDIKHLAA